MDPSSIHPPKKLEYVYNHAEGSVLLDHKGRPVTVDKLLATKPLRAELSTRPGPGNKKLTYISGDCISRTLNDIFGFDGWNLDIAKVQREAATDNHGKHTVVYTAQVRLTYKASGAYKEDMGSGEATDRSFGTACSNAIKSSITDAMKRAARHFGDKLGNSLYSGAFTINNAPTSLKDALDKYDIERANTKFGFPKDQVYPETINNNSNIGNIPPPQPNTETKPTSCVARPPLIRKVPVSINGVLKASNAQQPPPAATDASKTSMLFSYTEGKAQPVASSRPVSSRGRLSTGAANSLVTPAAEQQHTRPSGTTAIVNNSTKRPRSHVNPYVTTGRSMK